jgi:hypothetical protein
MLENISVAKRKFKKSIEFIELLLASDKRLEPRLREFDEIKDDYTY